MRRARKSWARNDEKEPEVNMTPMIDCVFQLLIFFMVGTRFRSEDGVLAANMPKLGQRSDPPTPVPLENVRIRLFLGGGMASNATICQVNQQSVPFDTLRTDPSGEALKAHLLKVRALVGDETPVTIDGEFQVPTRDVVCALNAAIAAGYKQVNFTVPEYIRRGGHLRR